MKSFKEHVKQEDTTVGSVAGLTGEPPVHKKKKKKDISVLKRFIEMRNKSEEIMRKRIEEKS